jgi:hypothetical protein
MGKTPIIGVATVCFMNRRLILLHTRLVVSVTVRWATQHDRGISLQIDVFQVHAADDWLTNASRHTEREECENKKYPNDSFCHVLLPKFAAAKERRYRIAGGMFEGIYVVTIGTITPYPTGTRKISASAPTDNASRRPGQRSGGS